MIDSHANAATCASGACQRTAGRLVAQRGRQLVRTDRDDDAIVVFAAGSGADRGARRCPRHGAHRDSMADSAAVASDVAPGCIGKQRREIDGRDEKIAVARRAGECLAHHVGKDLRRRRLGRRIERGDAQGFPDSRHGAQRRAGKALGDRLRNGGTETCALQLTESADQRAALAPAEAARGEHAERQVQWRRGTPRRQLDRPGRGNPERAYRQRQAAQQRVGRDRAMDALDQVERLPVRSDEQMLAVVERHSV